MNNKFLSLFLKTQNFNFSFKLFSGLRSPLKFFSGIAKTFSNFSWKSFIPLKNFWTPTITKTDRPFIYWNVSSKYMLILSKCEKIEILVDHWPTWCTYRERDWIHCNWNKLQQWTNLWKDANSLVKLCKEYKMRNL